MVFFSHGASTGEHGVPAHAHAHSGQPSAQGTTLPSFQESFGQYLPARNYSYAGETSTEPRSLRPRAPSAAGAGGWYPSHGISGRGGVSGHSAYPPHPHGFNGNTEGSRHAALAHAYGAPVYPSSAYSAANASAGHHASTFATNARDNGVASQRTVPSASATPLYAHAAYNAAGYDTSARPYPTTFAAGAQHNGAASYTLPSLGYTRGSNNARDVLPSFSMAATNSFPANEAAQSAYRSSDPSAPLHHQSQTMGSRPRNSSSGALNWSHFAEDSVQDGLLRRSGHGRQDERPRTGSKQGQSPRARTAAQAFPWTRRSPSPLLHPINSVEEFNSTQAPKCGHCRIDVPVIARTAVSHFFGRNRRGATWLRINKYYIQYCRKCYQRARYAGTVNPKGVLHTDNHQWVHQQRELVGAVLDRLEVREPTVRLRMLLFEPMQAALRMLQAGTAPRTDTESLQLYWARVVDRVTRDWGLRNSAGDFCFRGMTPAEAKKIFFELTANIPTRRDLGAEESFIVELPEVAFVLDEWVEANNRLKPDDETKSSKKRPAEKGNRAAKPPRTAADKPPAKKRRRNA